jgi:hypothetical protein
MKRKCLAVGIILLFIGVAIAPSINSNVAKAFNDSSHLNGGNTDLATRIHFYDSSPGRFLFIHFNSYIILAYDKDYVNETTFTPGHAYAIPVQIGYRVAVPNWLLHYHFRALKNWFLFHSFIAPNMIINVSAGNVPTWADIYPASPNIYVDIQNEFIVTTTTLVVSFETQAPPGPFHFSLNATAPALHRINGFFTTMNIAIVVQ